jgi:protein ImuB
MRVACLFVPDFPLQSWYRADPELHGRPVVVTNGTGPRAPVVAVSPEAEQRGVRVGLGAAAARTICAELVVRTRSADAERAAQAALCDVAAACAPRVEDAGGGTVYLECGGGPEDSEPQVASGLVAAAARVGLAVTVGIASTKLAARLAAQRGGAIVPPAEEWRFLAPLPVELLAPSPALRDALRRWGIRCLGDLAALPASGVATRLGREGLHLARRARGEDDEPLVPRAAPLRFEESSELDYGLETVEAFGFVARALLDRLTARLALRGLACGDLRLSLRLADRRRDERTVAVAAPSTDVKALLALLRLHLEAHPPPAPVEAIRLTAVPERVRPAQGDLFRPPGPAPERLSVTLARLTAWCGAERVGAPAVVDSHRPDAFALSAFDPPPVGDVKGLSYQGEAVKGLSCYAVRKDSSPPNTLTPNTLTTCPLALRAIRPPRALEVFTNRGQLDYVRPLAAGPPGCTGRVVTAAGPWRVRGEWWSDGTYHRDYYDVQLSDGAVYRLFFDRDAQTWFADGVYD